LKKLFSGLLIISFLILCGCSERKPSAPAPISSDYSARMHISCGSNEYGAEFFGTDRMKIISPKALSFLEFRMENNTVIAQYGSRIISDEQSTVPLKDLFISVSAMLKSIGSADYIFGENTITYSASGCTLILDSESGLPKSFIGNGYTIEFL